MKKNITIPNCITASRIIGAIFLIFAAPFSALFYVVYTICGLTDAVDGLIARAMKSETEFGARLDSVADLIFYTVLLFKIFPFLWRNLPKTIWIAVAIILLTRISAYLVAVLKYKKFASVHTYANKLTGLSLYLVPYLAKLWVVPVCTTVCVIAFLASLEELLIHLFSKQYNSENKSILMLAYHNS